MIVSWSCYVEIRKGARIEKFYGADNKADLKILDNK